MTTVSGDVLEYAGTLSPCNITSWHTYIDGTPVDCKSKAIWNSDLTVHHQLNDQVRLFADVLNVFDTDPGVDPSAAYALYGFNPAWAGPNIMGRYFRIGAKLDFE